jgi:hypothetical protein
LPRGGREAAVLRRHVANPSRILVATLAVLATLPALELDPLPESRVRHAVMLMMIGTVGWLVVGIIGARARSSRTASTPQARTTCASGAPRPRRRSRAGWRRWWSGS